jgi:uncharacterized protein (DUF983 family)
LHGGEGTGCDYAGIYRLKLTSVIAPHRIAADLCVMPSLLPSLLSNKCPNCRRGRVFEQKGIFPLSRLLRMNEQCPACGQKLIYERNNGAGINYALTVMLIFLNLLWYWPIFGLSYRDNSVYYFLVTSIGVVLLLQPWLMRLSRMIYLYLFIRYQQGALQ